MKDAVLHPNFNWLRTDWCNGCDMRDRPVICDPRTCDSQMEYVGEGFEGSLYVKKLLVSKN